MDLFDRHSKGNPAQTILDNLSRLPELATTVLTAAQDAGLFESREARSSRVITVAIQPVDSVRKKPALCILQGRYTLAVIAPEQGAVSTHADLVVKDGSRTERFIGLGTVDKSSQAASRFSIGTDLIVGDFEVPLILQRDSNVGKPLLQDLLKDGIERRTIKETVDLCVRLLERGIALLGKPTGGEEPVHA